MGCCACGVDESGPRCGGGDTVSGLGMEGAVGDEGDVASPLVVVLSVCWGSLGLGPPESGTWPGDSCGDGAEPPDGWPWECCDTGPSGRDCEPASGPPPPFGAAPSGVDGECCGRSPGPEPGTGLGEESGGVEDAVGAGFDDGLDDGPDIGSEDDRGEGPDSAVLR